jgi:hypothetical protein
MIFGLFAFEGCEQCCWIAGEASSIDFQLTLLADKDASKSRSIVAFQSNNRSVRVAMKRVILFRVLRPTLGGHSAMLQPSLARWRADFATRRVRIADSPAL